MNEEENEDVAVPTPSYGEATPAPGERTGAADFFLYVPDPESRSGWTTFRVRDGTSDRRSGPIGFRPR